MATTVVITGLSEATTYSFQISAIDSLGAESPLSTAISVTTQTGPGPGSPPTQPTNLHTTAVTDTSVSLAWTASTDPDGNLAGYDVYRDGVKIGTTSTPAFTDSTLSAGQTVVYDIVAYDTTSLTSTPSGSLSVTTTTTSCIDFCTWLEQCLTNITPAPVVITFPLANGQTIITTDVTVTWNAPSNTAGPFFYFISWDGGATYQTPTGTNSDTEELVDGSYTFCIYAVDTSTGLSSTPSCRSFVVNTGVQAPNPPVITFPTEDNDNFPSGVLTVTWTSGGGGAPPVTYSVSYDGGQSWNDDGGALSDSHTYPSGVNLFMVRAVDALGSTSAPAERSFFVNSSRPPGLITITPAGQLGCGVYEAYIMNRGATEIIMPLIITAYEWHRMLDDTSTAKITVDGTGGAGKDCCLALTQVQPWQHELALFRNGTRVWCGPILDPTYPFDQANLEARDLSIWWDRRLIVHDHIYKSPGKDLALIFKDYSDDAMNQDNSPGLICNVTPCGIVGIRNILASQYKLAAKDMRELSRSGLDWTVVDRNVLAGGLTINTPSIGLLTDDHFETPPTVSPDGLLQANDWVVRGQGSGTKQIIGRATAPQSVIDQFGLVTQVIKEPLIGDVASANAAAATRLAMTQQPPAVLDTGTLSPNAPVEVDDLVPGATVHIRLTESCYPVDGNYRIKQVDCTGGSTQEESVSITFQPLGTIGPNDELESDVTSGSGF